MKAYLVTKSGSIGEYEKHPFEVKKMIRTGRYRQATASERLKFVQQREDMLRNEKHPGMLDVLYVAPRQGNSDGYGVVQNAMREYFLDHGIYLNPFDRGQKVVFVHHYPYYMEPYKDRDIILYTMFETTKFPSDWGKFMRYAKQVLFPAQFLTDIAEEQFKIPSGVVPHGIEVKNFPFMQRNRTKDDVFTFLHYDAFKYRKGWDIALTAFDEEFGEDEKVQLVFKTTFDAPPITLKAYDKVKVICGKVAPIELRKILSDSDCFLFPTRGEGYGMTPLEAMATGMPAIVPNEFGISEYFNDRYCLKLDTIDEKAKYDNVEFLKMQDLGNYKTPTVESTRKAMRSAFNAWKKGLWITQMPLVSRQMSEYAHQYSLEKFCAHMALWIKAQCEASHVEPEK